MSDDLKKILADLKRDYLNGLPTKITTIQGLIKNGEIDDVETEFHKLKGTGKTYGLPEISEVGFLAEHICNAPDSARNKGFVLALELLAQIRECRKSDAEFDLEASSDFRSLRDLYEKFCPKD